MRFHFYVPLMTLIYHLYSLKAPKPNEMGDMSCAHAFVLTNVTVSMPFVDMQQKLQSLTQS